MDIKWNEQTKRVERIDKQTFKPTGATTGDMELLVDVNKQNPQTLNAESFTFGYLGPAALVEVYFGQGDDAPMLTLMFIKALAANTAYLIGNPFIGGDADVIASFYYDYGGEGPDGGVGEGVLHVTNYIENAQRVSFSGSFRFHYNQPDGNVEVFCPSFTVEHTRDE
ncbi:hypothetical protein [Pseudomonas sp. K2I15]|uniref:hypothetical protein n=1 Tax=unclassified Pseudomonas TaxID=196821 RepID=UPI000B4CED91|nr:hypothetical protein [Pseudomonas sp. K2I15]OWP68411.1 hypothetical protein CEC48_28440 [Pseudomonas sp. K2I15]